MASVEDAFPPRPAGGVHVPSHSPSLHLPIALRRLSRRSASTGLCSVHWVRWKGAPADLRPETVQSASVPPVCDTHIACLRGPCSYPHRSSFSGYIRHARYRRRAKAADAACLTDGGQRQRHLSTQPSGRPHPCLRGYYPRQGIVTPGPHQHYAFDTIQLSLKGTSFEKRIINLSDQQSRSSGIDLLPFDDLIRRRTAAHAHMNIFAQSLDSKNLECSS